MHQRLELIECSFSLRRGLTISLEEMEAASAEVTLLLRVHVEYEVQCLEALCDHLSCMLHRLVRGYETTNRPQQQSVLEAFAAQRMRDTAHKPAKGSDLHWPGNCDRRP